MNTKTRRRAHFGCSRISWGGREGVDHPKRTKTARCGCSRDGEGVENTKHAQTGVFCMFSGRKVSEHVRHAHTGMPYVLGGMWEVGGGDPGHEKCAETARFSCLGVGVVVGVVLVVFRVAVVS